MTKRNRDRLSLAGFLLLSLAVLVMAQGARAQTYYGTALVKPNTTTGNCGTWAASGSGAVNALTDSGVGCANNQVTISDGSHGTMQLVPSVFGVPNSAGILNMTSQQPLLFARGAARTATDAVDFDFRRTADYTTGGTAGFVNTAGRFYTLVTADRPSYEWSLLAVMDNNQAGTQGSENVAGYFQSHKRYATAGTWAFTAELQDHVANPTAPSVTLEFDLQGKGLDNNNARVIQDLWAKSDDGLAAVVGNGMRFNTDANTTLKNGLTFQGATISNAAIALGAGQKLCGDGLTCSNYLSQASNQWHFWANGTDVVDMTAFGLSSVALNSTVGGLGIPAGQKVCLDTAATCQNYVYDNSGTVQVYASNSLGASISSFGVTAPALSASVGNIGLPAGSKLCLDGNSTCANYLTNSGSTISSNSAISTTGALVTGDATHVGAVQIRAGAGNFRTLYFTTGTSPRWTIYADSGAESGSNAGSGFGISSYDDSGTALRTNLSINRATGDITASSNVTAATLTSTGNVVLPASGKVCLNGATCTYYFTLNGTSLEYHSPSGTPFQVSTSGLLNAGGGFQVFASPGVSCSGPPSAAFASALGIVTHC